MIESLKKYFCLCRILSKGNKSVGRQLLEILLLFFCSRLGPGFYILAQMYKKNVPLRDVMGYLSVKQYNRQIFKLNNRLYHRSSQNKVIEKGVLTAYGQPTPKLLGHYHTVCGLATDGSSLRTKGELQALLAKQSHGTKLCFKLVEAWGGEGFRAIECGAEGMLKDLSNQQVLSFDKFFSSLKETSANGVIIEQYLQQHPAFAAFNESSVNTVRVLVLRKADDEVVCIAAYLRIGSAGSLVDNLTAGGVTFPIDVNTGVMESGFYKYKLGVVFDQLPESGNQMAGCELPLFKEIVERAKEAMLAFPETRFVGADIAVSIDGPVVLELNVQPDYNGFAHTQVPSRTALSIT